MDRTAKKLKKGTATSMPQQAGESAARLPIEILQHIIDYVRMEEDIESDELWQQRPAEHYTHEMRWPSGKAKVRAIDPIYPENSTLRAISQTCKTLEALCAPQLWKNIRIRSSRYSLLKQLNIALARKVVADQVVSVSIGTGYDDYLFMRLEQHRYDHEAVWNENYLYFGGAFPRMRGFQRELQLLGVKLGSCPNLEEFSWDGPFRPWNPFYENLAKAPKLVHLNLGLSRVHIPGCASSGEKLYPPEPDNLHDFARCIQVAELAFGDPDVERHPDPFLRAGSKNIRSACPGLYKWLAGENQIRHLFIAAPVLFHQPWLLPLWAQALTIFVDLLRSGHDCDPGQLLNDGDDETDAIAAQRFRGHLIALEARKAKDSVSQHGKDDERQKVAPYTLQAEDVFELLMTDDTYESWRQFFPSWDDAETRQLMSRIVESKHRGDIFEREQLSPQSRRAIELKREYECNEPEDPLDEEAWFASPDYMMRFSRMGRI